LKAKPRSKDPFQDLTWSDLEQWAGNKTLSRGRNYQRDHRVRDLRKTKEGHLIAWVQGGRRYVTQVSFEGRDLKSVCDCPVGRTCKHAVAVVLEYLEYVKKAKSVPPAEAGDGRIEVLENREDEDREEDEYDEFEERAEREDSLDDFLREKSKEELVSLIKDFASRHPVVRESLKDGRDLSRGSAGALVKSVRKEIRILSARPGWMSYWDGEGYIPDYSRVRNRLQELLAQGYAGEVLEVGKELLRAGTDHVEMSHDEGETAEEIAGCVDVVFQAVPESSLSTSEQLSWAVRAALEDQYELCRGFDQRFEAKYGKEDWSIVADELLTDLRTFKPAREQDGFSRDFRRDQLSNTVVHALEKARRADEAIALCEAEAEKTGSYFRLVNLLIQKKRFEDAEDWIRKGIKASEKRWPGAADQLRILMRDLRRREGNWVAVASFDAEDFFERPTVENYVDLKKSAKKAGVWSEIEKGIMGFLEQGVLPNLGDAWPLEQTGLKSHPQSGKKNFPLCHTLIDIAIEEKRPDDVIRWYDKRKRGSDGWRSSGSWEDEIAKAIVSKYPERAVEIWKKIAEGLIAVTKPAAYEAAVSHLRKAQRVIKALHKEKEWEAYVSGLRKANERKRRFVEILDGLQGRRIIDGH
jgi:uncharacterized Zn finger protein